MGWSMNTERPDLWAIGTPIILAGQIALVLGLVLQLDRVWRDSRWAAAKMETVDEQLHDLKTDHHVAGHHARSIQRSSMPIGPAAQGRRSC